MNPEKIIEAANHESEYQSTNKSIIIKNLSFNVRSGHVDEIFSTFGEISSVKIGYVKGHSSGYAFVQYAKHASAAEAVENMNGGNIDGKVVFVALADPHKSLDEYVHEGI